MRSKRRGSPSTRFSATPTATVPSSGPSWIRLDEWGYPIVDDAAVPDELVDEARRTVAACPRLALRLDRVDGDRA